MSALSTPSTTALAGGKHDERSRGRALRERSSLKAVPQAPERMARVPFIAVLIALFGVGMAGLLMLNTSLQNQAFEGRALSRQVNELVYSQSELESEISRRASPQELARRASALGMRPNPHPVFVEVPSGKVIGTPRRVSGDEVPSMVVKTPAEIAADRAAAAAKRQAAAVEKAARERAAQLAAAQKAAAERAAAEQAAAAARQRAAQPGAARPSAALPSTRPSAQPSAGGN